MQHLFPDSVAGGPGLLERIRRFIQFHHLHHQIVQKYKEHPDSLQALVDGLKTREVADAEYDFLAKFLEPDLDEGRIAGDYQPDFPLLILFGFADRLACRGPDNATSVSSTARIDLAVLTFWALFEEIKARRLKRKRKREKPSRVVTRLSKCLLRKNGIDPDTFNDAMKKKMGKANGQLISWYSAQCKERRARDQRGSRLQELLAEGERLLRGHGIIR